MEELLKEIAAVGHRNLAERILLFGSRARGDNRDRSDIDIAVFGMPKENRIVFSETIEKLPTLLDFDIIFVDEKTDEALLQNIIKDGVTIMNKLTEKYNKFSSSISRLEESINEYEVYKISSSRDGVIQRFEFCAELAWKTTREYLCQQGYVEINSPKAVMKQAYSDGLIDDEHSWIELLNARNLTSHIYDENTAGEIFESIKTTFFPLLVELNRKLSK